MDTEIKEDTLHEAFEIGIILKGIHALLEIIGGIGAFFVKPTLLVSYVLAFTQDELSEDPKDILSNYLIHASHNLSISSSHFVALYLFSHGVIKLTLVIGLLKKKAWAYPASIIVFLLFIIYQLYRYTVTHSIWLIVFTVFDVIVIGLTLHEWRRIKSGK